MLRLSSELPMLEPLLANYDLVLKEKDEQMAMMVEDVQDLEKSCVRHMEEKKKLQMMVEEKNEYIMSMQRGDSFQSEMKYEYSRKRVEVLGEENNHLRVEY